MCSELFYFIVYEGAREPFLEFDNLYILLKYWTSGDFSSFFLIVVKPISGGTWAFIPCRSNVVLASFIELSRSVRGKFLVILMRLHPLDLLLRAFWLEY